MSDSNYLSTQLRTLYARELKTDEDISQLKIDLELLVNVAAGLETRKLELERELMEAKRELTKQL